MIREEEPPRPSTRLSTTEQLPSIAANRGLEPKKLSGLVRGELDWIVMKALEKDRDRRYETANGLATDVQRYLARRGGAGVPAVGGVPLPQVRPAEQGRAGGQRAGAVLPRAPGQRNRLGGARSGRSRGAAARSGSAAGESIGQLELILDEVARLEQAEKWSEALASARRAEPALAAGEAPPEIQERVRQALADLELVQRLEEIRAQSGTVWGGHESPPTH